jgi:hypothetical protein
MQAGDIVGGTWVTNVPRGACYAMSSGMAFGVAGRGAELIIQQKTGGCMRYL